MILEYRHHSLVIEDVPIESIARQVGTPFYCYSSYFMERQYQNLYQALLPFDPLICFALKANSNQAVIKTFARLGAGADVVSEGELRRALAAGIPANKIVFSGVGKTTDEIKVGIENGILQFNVESEPELQTIANTAEKLGKKTSVCLRVNPDVDAQTHAKISTGKAENKFGIDRQHVEQLYEKFSQNPWIKLVGLAVHIGSQITDFSAFAKAFNQIAILVQKLRDKRFSIDRIDIGGGIGIPYKNEQEPLLADYAEIISKIIAPLKCRIIVEPGRYLVGNAGVLVTKIIYVKVGKTRQFLIIDAAMNDLLRPSLYDAWHDFQPVHQPSLSYQPIPYDIVGPVCETGDTFAIQRLMPPLQTNDLLVVKSAGAYGAVMASTYNTRLLAPEVLVKGTKFKIVRSRLNYDILLKLDQIPDWLN